MQSLYIAFQPHRLYISIVRTVYRLREPLPNASRNHFSTSEHVESPATCRIRNQLRPATICRWSHLVIREKMLPVDR